MRFLGVEFSKILFLLAVVGGVGVAPVVATAAAPQAAAPIAAAEKEKPKNEKAVVEPIPWPEKYDPRTLKPIRLFMTREEVREMWGEPARYLYVERDSKGHVKAEKYISREKHDAAKRINNLLNDVYFRRTESNRYEIQVDYVADQSPELDHPVIRVFSVYFILKESQPVRLALKHFPEASMVCSSGCESYGDGMLLRVGVYPRQSTWLQREFAEKLVRLSYPEWSEKAVEGADWMPMLYLSLISEPEDLERTIREIRWRDRAVKWISFTIFAPRRSIELDRNSYPSEGRHILELGSFSP